MINLGIICDGTAVEKAGTAWPKATDSRLDGCVRLRRAGLSLEEEHDIMDADSQHDI